MNPDQTLNKLQTIIHETLPNLELFVDENIQPSSNDCESLQKQLHLLQEQLSVYKHLKTNREISPSFGIHSKVSEAINTQQEIKATEVLKDASVELEKVVVEERHARDDHHTYGEKKIEISLNQKFLFINELFNQNSTEYNLAIDQLNQSHGWADAESYLLGLKSVYQWKDADENYKRLREICKKRFE